MTTPDRKTLLGYSLPKVSEHPDYNLWELEIEPQDLRLVITQFKVRGLTPGTWSLSVDLLGEHFESRGTTERVARNRMYKKLRGMWQMLKYLLERGP